MTRKVDSSGGESLAGQSDKVGKRQACHQVQVAIVGDEVKISAVARASRCIRSVTTAYARTAGGDPAVGPVDRYQGLSSYDVLL